LLDFGFFLPHNFVDVLHLWQFLVVLRCHAGNGKRKSLALREFNGDNNSPPDSRIPLAACRLQAISSRSILQSDSRLAILYSVTLISKEGKNLKWEKL
jgi:hypothetical protein